MKQRKPLSAWLVRLLIVALFYPSAVLSQTSIKLDDFEGTSIRVVQPNEPDPRYQFLWNLYTAGNGFSGITTEDKHDGTKSLKNIYTGVTNWQYHFYPYTVAAPGFPVDGWQYAKKFVSGTWTNNTYNRLRFWIKVPAGLSYSTSGNTNFQFGTYIRNLTDSLLTAESNNMHFYHHADFRTTGEWEQVIIDQHPNHQRAWPGGTELGNKPNPTGEAGVNFFDTMTRFYLDFPYISFTNPVSFFMDGFEFYQETNTENEEQVYTVHAVYIPSTNGIEIGWQRNKNEDAVNHDVKYSFTSIHSIGWNAATAAPGGTGIAPTGRGGYNGMHYATTAINVSGQSTLYIGIKPQNSALFKQIAIPVNIGSPPPLTPPSTPSGLVVK